jgi:hypothetical protein
VMRGQSIGSLITTMPDAAGFSLGQTRSIELLHALPLPGTRHGVLRKWRIAVRLDHVPRAGIADAERGRQPEKDTRSPLSRNDGEPIVHHIPGPFTSHASRTQCCEC